jgi:hypothetical protein
MALLRISTTGGAEHTGAEEPRQAQTPGRLRTCGGGA